MDKRYYNKGFTLLDMILILSIVTLCILLILPSFRMPNLDEYNFANEYLVVQSECIKDNKQEEFISNVEAIYSYPIVFNEKGNIQMAQTISFLSKQWIKVVSQLGGGRIEFK